MSGEFYVMFEFYVMLLQFYVLFIFALLSIYYRYTEYDDVFGQVHGRQI